MEQWKASLLVVGILCYLVLVLIGILLSYQLCSDNKKIGILLFSLSLPIIGTMISLIYMNKKHNLFKRKKKIILNKQENTN